MKNNFNTFLRKTFLLLALIQPAIFGQPEIARIENIDPEEVKFTGFTLDSEQEVEIEAVGLHRRSRYSTATSAWILNADNREPVWELTDANSKWRNRKLREYHDAVQLPRGRYEVYYANFPGWQSRDGWSWKDFFFRKRGKDYEDVFEEFMISVRGNGKALTTQDVINYQNELKKQAAVALSGDREDLYEKQGFELKKPMDVIVYCLGEARGDGAFDYGWMINADTREQVWRFEERNAEYAGGSEKNRYIRETISLPAGKYAAFYVTDDSHSPREWNSPPPYDPAFWGLFLYTENPADKNNVRLFDYEDIPGKNIIAEFSRVRDDAYLSKGFTLKKDMNIRVYALGEGRNGDMYDFGWITNAQTHERVWEMRFRDTEHAGGNCKNRLVDTIIKLKKGSYILHYMTDDSHSFRRWNASPPFDQKRWGITLLAVDDNFNPRDVAEYNEEADQSIIARIVRVGDDERLKKRFSLKKDSDVRVYAIGEGRGGDMFDYAWIENENTGKVVWEMTYRNTNFAGGARKNREFNDTVFLKAGNYVLYFETDDSHSFGDWNAAPPRDPANYGVTLYKTKN